MSRRPDPSRAAQNQQTIKNLLKLEQNKTCADCKRNKHPRWASWNLGIFICIRCSGIHRGMGTHISRVKSVDLDAWTDEQLQSVLKWGNSRANKYWEAKLAPGHVPSDAKIENFIRTKYEMKRWVMDGPMPDPSTLGSDDDVPLAVVQERAKLDRSASQRTSVSSQPPSHRQPPVVDLIGGDDTINPPARPNTTGPSAVARPPPPPPPSSAQPAAAKQTKPADSLLGLDFFGNSQSTPVSRPGSAAPTSTSQGGISRPDLKQSILSLYATAPKPQAAPAQHERSSSMANTSGQSNVNSLTDAFSGLTFPSNPSSTTTTTSAAPKPPPSNDVFAGLTGFSSPTSPPPKSPSAGGDLFASIASSNAQPPKPAATSSNGLDFGFSQNFTSPVSQPAKPASISHDIFDLAAPAPAPAPAAPSKSPSPPAYQQQQPSSSVFNLSSNTSTTQPAQKAAPTTSTSNINSMFSPASIDPWGGNAWSTPAASTTTTTSTQPSLLSSAADTMRMPDTLTSNDIGAGWGAPTNNNTATTTTTTSSIQPTTTSIAGDATVAPEDDFGGWASAAPVATATASSGSNSTVNKPATGGFAGSDDLFSNVWE